ncbi:uncharacterized protein METZ01_LOCUS294147, partial [marine metagenome]
MSEKKETNGTSISIDPKSILYVYLLCASLMVSWGFLNKYFPLPVNVHYMHLDDSINGAGF